MFGRRARAIRRRKVGLCYNFTSAVKDDRFSPIGREEVHSVECTVSLLTDFEDAKDTMDWVLGEHGIRILFTHDKQNYDAAYLPEIAPSEGWSKEETILCLVKKSGFDGKVLPPETKVQRYRSIRCTMSHDEYLLHKSSQ